MLFAQSPVSVNPVTGTAGVTIPVYTVSSGQVSVPVFIQYTASGVKVKDVEGTAGMNWNLNGGNNQISRFVRGIPDDCTADSAGNALYGWMSSGDFGAGYATTFTIQNDNNFTNTSCTDESNDISHINGNVQYYYDTEPDLFFVSAPGLSCQLVYDRAHTVFRTVGYQDLVIQTTLVTTTGKHFGNIKQFTLTNDKGITYVFAQPDSVSEQTVLGIGTATYFKTKYQQYQHTVNYASAWNLLSITDAYGNAVTFNYTAAPVRYSADPVSLYLGGSSGLSVQYTVQQAEKVQTISNIGIKNNVYTNTNVLSFTWQTFNSAHQTGQTAIESIIGMGHYFQFNYTPVVSTTSSTSYTRNFLASYTDGVTGAGSPVNYQFGYSGQTYTSGTSYTALPDSSSTNYDYWGYYSTSAGSGGVRAPYVYVFNPATTIYPLYAIGATGSPGSGYSWLTLGANSLQVTPSTVATGTLNKITYPQGGSTSLVYESNDYYDPASLSNVQGGGIRVKQIIDSAGTGTTNPMVRNYSYQTPGGSNSSGQPVTLPQYAFTIPYSGAATGTTLYTDATAISPVDLSTEDHSILYSYVTVSQTGAGKTVSQYSNPYTYWSSGALAPGYMARYSCSTYGVISNTTNQYPFIPSPNNDYLRGLLTKTTSYNDAGAEVSEANYTYNISTPATLTAFKGDDNGSSPAEAKNYNTYVVNYGALVQPASVNTITYDSQNLTQPQSVTVNYTYGSAYHKLLTQQQTVNSDGSTLTANYSYAKDFTNASAQSNDNITAIYNLQQKNINVPIESYTQATPSGGSAVTTSASLNYFRDTVISSLVYVLPAKVFKWISPNGGTFTPLTISGSVMTKSTNYFDVANFDSYDQTGFPLTTDDNNRHFQTTIPDHFSGKAVASFANCNYLNIAFNDFDSDPGATTIPHAFTFSGTQAFTPATGHAGNAYGLGSTQTATSPAQQKKNPAAVNYIFSIWTNAATSGTLTVTGAGNTYPITLAGSSAWVYNEITIPASVFTGTTVPITFSSTVNVAIDDILFYPDCAEAATVTYDATQHHKLAETNTNGVSSYFTYDQWGRLLFQYDQDKNIVLKKGYITPGNVTDFVPTINFSPTSGITVATPVTFTAYGGDANTAAANVYKFDFGDGTSTTTTSAVAPAHTYAPGNYTATLTVTSDYFPTKTATTSSFMVSAAAHVPLHYVNNCTSKGDITTVLFYQGGVLMYTVPVSSLNSTTVLPGVYNIVVNMNSHDIQYNSLGDGTGYQSVEILGASDTWCFNYSPSGTFTYNGVDLTASTSITFEVNTNSCTGGDE